MTPQRSPESGPVDPSGLVQLGVIRRPHGVRGEASVEMLTDDPGRLSELESVLLVSPRRDVVLSVRILSSRLHKDRALALFDAFRSPEEVAAHRGWTVEIPEHARRPLDSGEYYIHDLIGLEVRDPAGRVIGRVAAAIEGSAQLLLRVDRTAGGHFEMPFAAAFVKGVDIEAGSLVVELPDGLESLNDPEPPRRRGEGKPGR